MGVIQIPKLRCALGALLGVLVLLPEIEMRAQSGGCPAANPTTTNPAQTNLSIPWGDLGSRATAQSVGDGLAVIGAAEGARLRCVFQQLEGEATREGLWLASTVTNAVNGRFRIVAEAVGTNKSVTLPATNSPQFFRLSRP